MIEFQGKFDENLTKALNKRIFKKSWWVFLLLGAIMLALGVFLIVAPQDPEDLFFGVFLIAFGVLLYPLVLLLTNILQKNMNKSMSIMSTDTTEIYRFYPDRLVIVQQKRRTGAEEYEYEATTNTRYSYLYRVEETRENYFLFISKAQSHVINKADLKQGTMEELNAILTAALGTKFKKMKRKNP